MSKFVKTIFALSLVLLASCGKKEESKPTTEDARDSIPQLILRVSQSSKLYTSEYQIHKIITHDDVVRLNGSFFAKKFSMKLPLADRKIAIPIDATLKGYVDMSSFSENNIRKMPNGKITVILPEPHIIVSGSKVDHNGIKQYVSFSRSNYSDEEMSNFEQQGMASIIESIPELGIIESTRDGAARIIIPMLVKMGYKEEDITVEFPQQYMGDALIGILEGNTMKLKK